MEGASWSLIEELAFGKPIMVYDTGFYQEIPDTAIFKIKTENEIDTISEGLIKIVENKELRESVGREGKRFAEENFSSKKYVQNFSEFVANIVYRKSPYNLTDKVSKELSLMGIDENMEVVNSVAKKIYDIVKLD